MRRILRKQKMLNFRIIWLPPHLCHKINARNKIPYFLPTVVRKPVTIIPRYPYKVVSYRSGKTGNLKTASQNMCAIC